MEKGKYRQAAEGILDALFVRGVGHTHVMKTGAENNDCVVIVANGADKHEFGKKAVPLFDCAYRLRGLRKPVAIDNFALQHLLQGLMTEHAEELRKLRDEYKRQAELA